MPFSYVIQKKNKVELMNFSWQYLNVIPCFFHHHLESSLHIIKDNTDIDEESVDNYCVQKIHSRRIFHSNIGSHQGKQALGKISTLYIFSKAFAVVLKICCHLRSPKLNPRTSETLERGKKITSKLSTLGMVIFFKIKKNSKSLYEMQGFAKL